MASFISYGWLVENYRKYLAIGMTNEREERGKVKKSASRVLPSIQDFPGQKSRANASPASIYKTTHGKIYILRTLVGKKTYQPARSTE